MVCVEGWETILLQDILCKYSCPVKVLSELILHDIRS